MLLSCNDFPLIWRRFYNELNQACKLRFWSRCSSFCRIAKRYMCAVKSFLAALGFSWASFLWSLSIRQTQPVCVQIVSDSRDRWRCRCYLTSSRTLPITKRYVCAVKSPRVLSNIFIVHFAFRETLRGCGQRVSGDRFARQLSRALLFGLLDCHQTQHT